jgi:hypothetical protein
MDAWRSLLLSAATAATATNTSTAETE